MGQEDFPTCIYCDSSDSWFIVVEGKEVIYNCGSCDNSVVVKSSDDHS